MNEWMKERKKYQERIIINLYISSFISYPILNFMPI